jgi:hypothetical protein
MSNVQIRNKSFLSRVNKKQNFEIDSAATTGGQGKLTYLVYFAWTLLGAELSIFIFSRIVKNNLLRIN